VSIHVPLKDSTRNLIGTEALSRMKPEAFLINMARGGIVDEEALYEALTEGRLRGAALDVHKEEGEGKISPLAGLPNVVLTPHMGAGTIDTQREIGDRVIEIVDSFVAATMAVKPDESLIMA
jgi:phosphoglycerate dehydrogenase-like enzyme